MKKSWILGLALGISTSLFASDEALITQLKNVGISDVEIQNSPIKGLKTLITKEGILYASEDGKYLLQGKMFELSDKGVTDISGKLLLKKLENLSSQMIVYPAKQEKFVVTVFMDITCHYCHLLHQQIKEYNDLGITLRYLAFPRNGLESKTAQTMEAIWTAKDPAFALNETENGNPPKELKKPNVIAKQYELGLQFGVRGTPSLILANGEMLGGYLPPKQLLATLQAAK